MNHPPPPPSTPRFPGPIGIMTQPTNCDTEFTWKNVVAILLGTSKLIYLNEYCDSYFVFVFSVGLLVILAFPSGMIYVGFTAKDNCPAESRIPVFFAVFGALLIFRIILYCFDLWVMPRCFKTIWPDMVYTLSLLAILFMMISCFIGLFLVLKIAWPNFKDEMSRDYCHPAVYILAFVTFVDVIFGSLYWCTCFCCFFPKENVIVIQTVTVETVV